MEYHYKPKIDLTGKIFGHLTVDKLNQEKSDLQHHGIWQVHCDCENQTIFDVYRENLISGNTVRCKFCRSKNLIGQKFNKLLVQKRLIINNHTKWQCICDCGNITIVDTNSLISGHTKSCGCLQRENVSKNSLKDLTGQKFGLLTVTKISNRVDSRGIHYWYCDCDCGTKNIEIVGSSLRNGRTQSCGCIKSHGEEKIAKLLNDNNINFIREYQPENCFLSSGYHPRFDFAILNKDNTIAYFIEYQGEQHFLPRGNIFTLEKVQKIQQRDKEKKEYCDNNNIPLVYITYTNYNFFGLEDIYFPNLIH